MDYSVIPLLSIFGVGAGFVSGFFGVGGGMILIPMLLFANFDMKQAVSISIIQMIFSSLFGSFLNFKQNKKILHEGLILGAGGFIGGLSSGIIISTLSKDTLQYMFVSIVLIAIYKVSTISIKNKKKRHLSLSLKLIPIGFFAGIIAMSIGVGGTVILTPILAGYLHYNFSLGLFFVMFSSMAGFLSLSILGNMLYIEGFIVGISSLLGVYLGIYLKSIIHIKSYKFYILGLYNIILILMIIKIYQ
ncbi:membrane protein [hydrothermal vent metagenome]|uniref:Membrane protein n=1 Tax=hydrothermal vent metagenome TaxID=652676 RepID=A0A3B1E0K5_9ZZZZ